MKNRDWVPKAAERETLLALHNRFCRLLAMLPTDMDELDEVDISQLVDWELIATEMTAVADEQLAILTRFDRSYRTAPLGTSSSCR